MPNLNAKDAFEYPSIPEKHDAIATSPIKAYAVIPTPTWGRTSAFTIQDSSSGNTILAASIQRSLGTISVHIQREDKTVLATCRLKGFTNKKYLYLGPHPDCTDLADWKPVTPSAKFDPSKYKFEVGGEEYSWTRTRRAEYGVSKWASKSFKLVRVSGGEVLAVYVHKTQWKKRDDGRVDWFCEVESEVEWLALAAIMGIEEQIRREE